MHEKLTFLSENTQGTLIQVLVQPRASKNELVGIHEDSLKIRLAAPPVEGEANKECVKFMAKLLNVPKSGVEILRGHKARRKTLLIKGLSLVAIEEILQCKSKL